MRTALALSLVLVTGMPALAETYQLPARSLRDELIASKPNPSYYTFASFLLPGSGQLALGEYPKAGLMLLGAAGVYAGLPYATDALKLQSDSALGVQTIGLLLWGAWSAYDAYLTTMQARDRIEQKILALDGSRATNLPTP